MRRFLAVILASAAIIILLLLAHALIAKGGHSATTTTATPSPTRASPPSGKSNPQEALDAAVAATDKLTASLLLSKRERWQIVHQLVYPAYRKRRFRHLNKEAHGVGNQVPLWLDEEWQYDNRLQALVRSQLGVSTSYYHVDSFRPGRATLALYIITHWTSATGEELKVPAVVIVKMRWHKGNWLFVSQGDPSPSRVPPVHGGEGLTFEELQNLYEPYLAPKGFVEYKK
jgi:hypothetical protein